MINIQKIRKFLLAGSLVVFLASSLTSVAQNTPLLNQVAVPGTVTEITTPSEPSTMGNVNIITTTVPLVPIQSISALPLGGGSTVRYTSNYLDGFARTFQSVTANFSEENGVIQDLISIKDNKPNKEHFSFLNYTVNHPLNPGDGIYRDLAFQEQRSYYQSRCPNEGYTSYFEKRNISNNYVRATWSLAPGKGQIGQNKAVFSRKETNVANEVRIWEAPTYGVPSSTSYYAANQLFGEETVDQEGKLARSYTDKDGQLVMKKVQDGVNVDDYSITYYIYDEMGRLRYTLSPKAVEQAEAAGWILSAAVLEKLCFQYHYDAKGRLAKQKLPGEIGFTYFVYDKRNRLVLRQAPNETAAGNWEVVFQDNLNRVVATSMFVSALTRDNWQSVFDDYTTGTFPQSDLKYYLLSPEGSGKQPTENAIAGNTMMSYQYYDDYTWLDAIVPNNFSQLVNTLSFTELQTSPGAETPLKGLRNYGSPTGSRVRILKAPEANASITGDWNLSANYYDDKGRAVFGSSTRFKGDTVLQTHYTGSQYDFANRLLISKHYLLNAKSEDGQLTHQELTKNSYNATTGQLVQVLRKVDGGQYYTPMTTLEYDGLGRISRETLGNNGERRDYTYNIRGELTGINAEYAESGSGGGTTGKTFGESLKYDYGFTQPRRNGKLAGVVWRGSGGVNARAMAYGYGYDTQGRLQSAEFRNSSVAGFTQVPTAWSKDTIDYSVSNMIYDKNGNILSMDQRGMGFINGTSTPIDMDKLNYTYEANGNQLLGVSDNATVSYNLGDFNDAHQGTDYAYDNNGNLTQDLNKGITNVTYTHFNKPQTISFANGNKIAYSYDASGSKIQEWVSADSKIKRTDYIGNFIYENDTLHQAMTPQGRTVWENGSPSEEFFVKDHLGNIRTIIETKIKPIKNYLGKYELASANLEEMIFEHHDEIRDDKPGSTDPSDMKAGRLNGAEQEHRIGTALLLKVMAGDKIELHVDNYYENYEPGSDDPVSTEDLLADLISTLSGGIGGLGEGESHNPEMVDRFLDPDKFLSVEDLLRGNEDPQRPKAYLNYILYDENMEIVRTFTGSFQANGNGGWQTIGTQAPLELPSNGYLAVYLSNQSKPSGCGVCGDVYFDDFELEISTGKLKEETHYYPFGLPMANAGAAASGLEPNRHKYQGNEYVKDAGLNWMDFNARQYDPQIGRFLGIDPLAASGGQDMFSPYAAMGNNPGMLTDPEGLAPGFGINITRASFGEVGMDGFGFSREGSMAFWTPGQGEPLFDYDWSNGGGGASQVTAAELDAMSSALTGIHLGGMAVGGSVACNLVAGGGDGSMLGTIPEVTITGKRTSWLGRAWNWVKGINFDFSLNADVSFGAQIGASAEIGGREIGGNLNLVSIELVEGGVVVSGPLSDAQGNVSGSTILGKDGMYTVKQGIDGGYGLVSAGVERQFTAGTSRPNDQITGQVGYIFGTVEGTMPLSQDAVIKSRAGAHFEIGAGARFLFGIQIKAKIGFSHD